MFIKKFLISVWEVVEVLSVALATVFIIYTFIAQPFKVQGASMEPNFSEGNYLVVDELTYRFRPPERGEIIVFHNPADESEFYIKRIIGLPGETVDINVKDNTVKVDGNVLAEDYMPPDTKLCSDMDSTCRNVFFKLSSDEYFVMGDNRPRSSDSRRWGAVVGEEIVGVVRLRFWPMTDFKFYSSPATQ